MGKLAYTYIPVTDNVTPVSATVYNTDLQAAQTSINNVDNTQVGSLGFYASQIIPTSGAQATFAGTQNYTFPQAIVIPGGSTTTGYQFNTASGLGVYGGTGVPSFNAPNGSVFIRYDSSTASIYTNTSGASSSGTTWTAIPLTAGSAYAAQGSVQLAYTAVGNETNASPGTMATLSFTLPSTSAGTNNNWRVWVRAAFTINVAALASTVPLGIGSTNAGTSAFPMYAKANGSSLTISGGNCRADAFPSGSQVGGTSNGNANFVEWSAIFANGTAQTFTALMGANVGTTQVINGSLSAIAIAN